MEVFISREEWKAIQEAEDETLINEILSRVYNAAIETCIRKMPEMISRMVATTTATKAMTKDFFDKHKEFENHKEIVGSVIQDVESKHAGWDYKAILNEAAPVIQAKIDAVKTMPNLALDKPKTVNLDGNGVI